MNYLCLLLFLFGIFASNPLKRSLNEDWGPDIIKGENTNPVAFEVATGFFLFGGAWRIRTAVHGFADR